MTLKIDNYISPIELQCEELRKNGKKIGIANGCFDLLHNGHLHLLREAKKHCDALIVAINSDESVRKLKGHGRPIDNRSIRYKKLLSSRLADMIWGFDTEKELLEFVKKIKPDALIKGADYHGVSITSAGFVQSYGGKIVLVPLLQGFSTTNEIAKR